MLHPLCRMYFLLLCYQYLLPGFEDNRQCVAHSCTQHDGARVYCTMKLVSFDSAAYIDVKILKRTSRRLTRRIYLRVFDSLSPQLDVSHDQGLGVLSSRLPSLIHHSSWHFKAAFNYPLRSHCRHPSRPRTVRVVS